MVRKITPFLWFDKEAEDAARFYCSIFKNSKIIQSTPMIVVFELENERFMAVNGGPEFKFTEAVSFFVDCQNQEEVDFYWEKLIAGGGKESQCGWLKDKYGLSWQIIPNQLPKLMSDPDRIKADRVMKAMFKMKKIIVEDLEKAYSNS